MRTEEFEVVRGLIAGRAPVVHGIRYTSQSAAPASFREIDGEILARQYVAHRKFLETEAMAQRFGGGDGLEDVVRAPRLRGERRHMGGIGREARSGGWLASLSRLFWRR